MARQIQDLQTTWKTLYAQTLPAAAKSRSKAQKVWPVSLDHCFARIILDNAVGKDVPWMSKLKSPAYKNMTSSQLEDAISMGTGILEGDLDLDKLNQQSLAIRGKNGPARKKTTDIKEEEVQGGAKKRVLSDDGDRPTETSAKKVKPSEEEQDSSKESFDVSIIEGSSDLTPYRKKVLALLCDIPRGRWTTYKAMSDKLQSSPRAVGNAMRNNPYAPMCPCHRVLANGGAIGGFGGDWGLEGRHAQEKLKLLRTEGVKFDGKSKAVGKPFTF